MVVNGFQSRILPLEFSKLRNMLACMSAWSAWKRTWVLAWLTSQRALSGSMASVPMWLRAKSFPTFHFTCQRANKRANVS